MSQFAHSDDRQRRAIQQLAQKIIAPLEITSTKTAAYSATIGELVLCNPTGGGFTVTLPTAEDRPGRYIAIKNASGSTNTITVDGADSETIDGAANKTITTAYGSMLLISDGENWLTL
jgi:hypothetical protein